MEEIDIIELLQRIKEGKAPQRIEINGNMYTYTYMRDIMCKYLNDRYKSMFVRESITFNTRIKILDKPIIEELD